MSWWTDFTDRAEAFTKGIRSQLDDYAHVAGTLLEDSWDQVSDEASGFRTNGHNGVLDAWDSGFDGLKYFSGATDRK